MMPKSIHLFVSSSPELQVEREVIGQVVATLPLTLGWQIDHTPMPGELAVDGLAQVTQCDLYVLVLGHDYAAPMGAELRQALLAGKPPMAYRKRCSRSPSSQDAVRRLGIEWRVFSTPQVLRSWFKRDLLKSLLRQAIAFGLDLTELEGLLKLAQDDLDHKEGERGPAHGRSEAGRSGIILGREVWEGTS